MGHPKFRLAQGFFQTFFWYPLARYKFARLPPKFSLIFQEQNTRSIHPKPRSKTKKRSSPQVGRILSRNSIVDQKEKKSKKSALLTVMRLRYASLLVNASLFSHFWKKIFKLLVEVLPFSKILATCQTRPQLLIFNSTVSLSLKKSIFLKISDDVIACDLRFATLPLCPSPIKNPAYAYASVPQDLG